MVDIRILEKLNAPTAEGRLAALRELKSEIDAGIIEKPVTTKDTNNHIHTIYSFSPYSPSAAVYFAYMSGLCTAGIIDHDAIAGAREFIEAGKIIGIATTIGCEVRVNFTGTPLEGKRLNNPDEVNSAYIAFHGLPHDSIDALDEVLSQIRRNRDARDRKQVEILNGYLPEEVMIDFEKDVMPVSMTAEGGSITERHILMALARKLVLAYGKGGRLISYLTEGLGLDIKGRALEALEDESRPDYEYNVLNVLKSGFVDKFFIKGGDDQFDVEYMVKTAKKLGAIPTYCYLGDVGESPTGDKKAQKFEDDILDELFPVLKGIGFEAIAYMPSRNTMQQLEIVMEKCEKYGFLQISGEDINQPSQSFICEKLREPVFEHLVDSTWALVGHELAGTADKENVIYCDRVKSRYPDVKERTLRFAETGRKYCLKQEYDGELL